MTKLPPKSARAISASKGKVLYCEIGAKVLAAQSKFFEQAGYAVEHAIGRALAVQALQNGSYDVVILGHTLTKDDRHHLPYMAKKWNGATQVLVLHASGKHPAVDVAIDSRDGEKAVLGALESLMQQRFLIAS
jgi:DNA-binding NtrC family response regulator